MGLLVITRFSMFVNIQSFVLNAAINTQTMQLLDAIEQDEATGGSPEVDDQDAEALRPEESPAMTIESTIRR